MGLMQGSVELAMRPDFYPDQVAWMPRERHQLMRAYLADKGRLAHYMMTLTTTIQANLDYVSEADMAQKVRVATRLSPIVTALFANSPFGPNGLCGWRSHRAAVWFDVDSARCGFPEVYFHQLVTEVILIGSSTFRCFSCFEMTNITRWMGSLLDNSWRMAGEMNGQL